MAGEREPSKNIDRRGLLKLAVGGAMGAVGGCNVLYKVYERNQIYSEVQREVEEQGITRPDDKEKAVQERFREKTDKIDPTSSKFGVLALWVALAAFTMYIRETNR